MKPSPITRFTPSDMRFTTPVSYTHLDVYKRQAGKHAYARQYLDADVHVGRSDQIRRPGRIHGHGAVVVFPVSGSRPV